MTIKLHPDMLLGHAYRMVLFDALKFADRKAGELDRANHSLAALQSRVEHQQSTAPESGYQGLVDERDAAQKQAETLASQLESAEQRITGLLAELEESDRQQKKALDLRDRAVVERGEQTAKVTELLQTVEELRSAAPAPPADVSKLEKQLAATIGSLRKAEDTARAAEQRATALEEELTQVRESNLRLSEQAARVEALEKALADAQASASSVTPDVTAVRRAVEVAMRHFDDDNPEKTARALAAAVQELNRLEGGK